MHEVLCHVTITLVEASIGDSTTEGNGKHTKYMVEDSHFNKDIKLLAIRYKQCFIFLRVVSIEYPNITKEYTISQIGHERVKPR